jgi:ParB family chromosome partitioning protein
VANKLRLLKLPRDVLENLRVYGLSERHGRALLRLSEPNEQRMALEYIAANSLTVAATEEYIEALLTAPEAAESPDRPEPRRTLILKDVRVFLNTLTRGVDLMKQGGIGADMKREETENALILTISIPKTRQETAAAPETT